MLKKYASNLVLGIFLLFTQELMGVDWSVPQEVGQNYWGQSSAVAVNKQGDTLILYTRLEYSTEKEQFICSVENSIKSLQGDWVKIPPLSSKAYSDIPLDLEPQVAFDNSGIAHAVWRLPEGDHFLVQGAMLLPGAPWWVPEVITNSTYQYVSNLHLGFDKGDNAIAVWNAENGDTNSIECSRFLAVEHRWQPVGSFILGNARAEKDMVIDHQGTAWVTVLSREEEINNVFITSLEKGKSSWNDLKELSKGTSIGTPRLSCDRKGNILARWQQKNDKDELVFQAFYKEKESTKWQKTAFPEVESHIYTSGQVTVDPKGNMMLLWLRNDDPDIITYTSLLKGSLKWSEPTDFPSSDCMIDYAYGIDSAGNRLLTWNDKHTGQLKYSLLPFASKTGWTAPANIRPFKGMLEEVSLGKHNGLIFYTEEFTLKSIEGSSLFSLQKNSLVPNR